jgi:hypothetical protein
MTKFDPNKDVVIVVEGGCVTDYFLPEGLTITIVDKDADTRDEDTEKLHKAALRFMKKHEND